MNRKDEIRQLNQLSPQQVIERAGDRLLVCETVAELHKRLADSIFHEIRRNNQAGRPTRLILPVGPTGQYPILARLLNQARLSLRDCHIFFMDEYCDEQGAALPSAHPLSFKGIAQSLFLDAIADECKLNRAQVYFPDERNIDALPALIDALGGIDTCYGGIGIHGHVAFNEPEPGVSRLPSRKVRLNDFTVTINAIRAQVGGNLESFPRYAYTLGLLGDSGGAAHSALLPQRHRAGLGQYRAAAGPLRRARRRLSRDAYPRAGLRHCDGSRYAAIATQPAVRARTLGGGRPDRSPLHVFGQVRSMRRDELIHQGPDLVQGSARPPYGDRAWPRGRYARACRSAPPRPSATAR